MVEHNADDYRAKLLRILDKDARKDEVMEMFEQNLELEADNAKAAAYLALSEADLSHLTSIIDEVDHEPEP
ncbi:hypothetical protein [Oceanisphaera avium]|uniref:Uncharacterized protein n=1 Tax=Oceanisphaera avium TaxID=1903694 RepID=A0A1Y0CZ06_9GAMM|nr:hypothetical protein [Oceanisphaera avium]ART80116.1 hypothetical protein CBP12_08120 [Oceanisphaera avium]